jgi:peptidoglycan/xylan/chitin deacetylase (PgdA/CDA1 family)
VSRVGDLAALAGQRVRDRLDGRAVLLCYHRVAALEHDPQLLAVTPERFRAQLQMLQSRFSVQPLEELVGADVRARRVAITFDDGYADNLAALRDAGAPAAVFVTTGQTGARRELWWDELERLLGKRSGDGDLMLRGRRFDTSDSHAAYEAIHASVRQWPTEEVEAAMVELRAWAGESPTGDHRDSHRQLDVDELQALDAVPGVEIGAHSVTHPSLAAQPEAVQQRELVESKIQLERWLGHPVRSMSYPYGGSRDQSKLTRRLAREAGYSYAAANFPGLVGPRSDRWRLPRVLVRDWEAAELEARLERLLRHA